MDIKKLAENLELDLEDFNGIFEIYIETTSSDLQELKAALRDGDAQRAHERSHSIKGSSGTLGLDELYELAKQIDDRARVNSLNGLEDLVSDFYERYEKLVADFERNR
jgi:HPt (histidine-containing phosphotransfer) domain-containing protein